MVFYPYPFLACPNGIPSVDDLSFTPENYNKLFANIHRMQFNASLHILIDPFSSSINLDPTSLDVNIQGSGPLTRELESSGDLLLTGETPILNSQKKCLFPGEAPVFSGGGNSVSIEIDTGKCFKNGGLIFPSIFLFLGGQGSNQIGEFLLGNVDFQPFGPIPIYVQDLPSDALLAIADGSIIVTQTYDMLGVSPRFARVGDQVTIRPLNDPTTGIPFVFDGLEEVQDVYFGPFKVDAIISSSQISFTIPQNARTDYITFISYSPKYNKWRSTYLVTII